MKKIVLIFILFPFALFGATLEEVQNITKQLACQCGCAMLVSTCSHDNCPSAVPLRTRIATELDQGKNAKDIVNSLVSEYGEKILASPRMHGFHALVWFAPLLFFFFGGGIIVWMLVRWRKRGALKMKEDLNRKEGEDD